MYQPSYPECKRTEVTHIFCRTDTKYTGHTVTIKNAEYQTANQIQEPYSNMTDVR